MGNQALQGVEWEWWWQGWWMGWGDGRHLTLKYLVFKSLNICSLDLRSVSKFV